jgi:hypothetical protein
VVNHAGEIGVDASGLLNPGTGGNATQLFGRYNDALRVMDDRGCPATPFFCRCGRGKAPKFPGNTFIQ